MNKLGGDVALEGLEPADEDRAKLLDVQTAGQLNALAARCGNTADIKGFHQPEYDADSLEMMADLCERNGVGYTLWGERNDQEKTLSSELRRIASQHRMLHTGWKLMLIVSELGEAAESLRKTGVEGIGNSDDDNFGEEMGDANIRLLDLCSFRGVHIGDETLDKMAVNTERPYLHGKKG
jgi:NTP pyrophosphatase (non-canonical NTP hydrolase)